MIILPPDLTIHVSPQPAAAVYSLGQLPGGRWAMRGPDRRPFWSFGVDCVSGGDPWESYDPGKPGYHAWSIYPGGGAWADDTLDRIRRWGFNSIGGWSDTNLLTKNAKALPYFVVLHLGSYFRAPWDDLFSKGAYEAIDKAARDQIEPIKNDKLLAGYFSDNELGWWDDTVFLNYVKLLPANSEGHKRAHKMLRDMYGTFTNFKKDWITPSNSWKEFDAKTELHLRPGGNGMRAVNKWMGIIGNFYYKSVHDAIRRYDPKRLILGDRYCQYYNIELARSSAKWVDAVSTNMGADFTDGTLTPFFLDTLHKVTGKPILITEFYMCATENRSGNRNTSANFPVVATQVERAAAFTRNVEELGKLPYVIGAHWFQFHDEPMYGRGDGENYNMGLVDIYGKPYEEMVSASAALNVNHFLQQAGSVPVGAKSVPAISFDPMASPSLRDWPRSAGWLASRGEAFGDMYVAHDATSLYVALFATNYIDESLYIDGVIPSSERPHWVLTLNGSTIDVRYGGSKKKGTPLPAILGGNASKVRLIERPDLKHTVILQIPLEQLKSASKLRLDSKVNSHSRGESTEWHADLNLNPS